LGAALDAFGAVHSTGAYTVFAQVLLDFQHQALAVIALDEERIQNFGYMAVFAGERDVYNRPDNLGDAPDVSAVVVHKVNLIPVLDGLSSKLGAS
jgi:hypothetical protein